MLVELCLSVKQSRNDRHLGCNDSCKRTKADFMNCKHEYQNSPNVLNKSRFLDSRSWSNGAIIPIYKKVILATQQTTVELLMRTQWQNSSHFYSECVLTNGAKLTAHSMIPNMVSGIIVQQLMQCSYLHATIQKSFATNKKLWCTFLDYERAFDTVNRDGLWAKLISTGFSCKTVNMITAIYAKGQPCVKLSYNNIVSISDFFEVTIGLKQCEPLSPILFILFINDI